MPKNSLENDQGDIKMAKMSNGFKNKIVDRMKREMCDET
jgi:hypothetical protein